MRLIIVQVSFAIISFSFVTAATTIAGLYFILVDINVLHAQALDSKKNFIKLNFTLR